MAAGVRPRPNVPPVAADKLKAKAEAGGDVIDAAADAVVAVVAASPAAQAAVPRAEAVRLRLRGCHASASLLYAEACGRLKGNMLPEKSPEAWHQVKKETQ